jgi:hypothetical protein
MLAGRRRETKEADILNEMRLKKLTAVLRVRYRRIHPPPQFLISCLCVLPCGLAAQNTADKPEAMTALSLVKQAMGGARWDDVRTLHAQGKVEVGELRGNYEAWLDLRRLYSYTELRLSHPSLGDLRWANGWNGSVAWSADQTGDACVKTSESAKNEAAADAYVEAFAYLLKSSSPASLTVKGDANLHGQRCRVLVIAPPEGSPFELWTDSSASRIARIVPLSGVSRDVMDYGDFRLSDGLLLPFHLQEHDAASGKSSAVRTIDSMEIDRDPPEGRFDPPAAALSGLQFPAGTDSVSLPFRYDRGQIYMPVSINGRRFENFIFDTGAENSVDVGLAKSMGLKVVKTSAAYGGGTKGVNGGLTKVGRVEIGGLHMENQIINAVPLGDIDLTNGGLVGYELAKRSVVTIDYGLRRITFTKPESFRVPVDATRLPLHFASTTSILVAASVDGIPGEFDLDTGNSAHLFLYRPFAQKSGLLAKYQSGRGASVRGIGGKAGVVFFAPSLAIGDFTASKTVAGIMLSKTGSGGEEYVAGNIGNLTLRQYKVTLDYRNAAIYLERDPSYRADTDWTYDSDQQAPEKRGASGDLGLPGLRRRSGGPVEITRINTGAAASRAGVKRGDFIMAVDGVRVEDVTVENLFKQLHARPGTAVRLTIRHGAVTRDVTLTTQ